VCLSLLGTFSGASATEKWDPAVSSLYQVSAKLTKTSAGAIGAGAVLVLSAQPSWYELCDMENLKVELNGKLSLFGLSGNSSNIPLAVGSQSRRSTRCAPKKLKTRRRVNLTLSRVTLGLTLRAQLKTKLKTK